MTSVRDISAAGGLRQCAIAADTDGRQLPRDAELRAHARFVARGELQHVAGSGVRRCLEHGRADAVEDHGHADAMQEAAQVRGLDVAALEPRDLLREQRGDHRLAPQVGHLVAEVRWTRTPGP